MIAINLLSKVPVPLKICKCCKENLPLWEFNAHKQTGDGKRSFCSKCGAITNKLTAQRTGHKKRGRNDTHKKCKKCQLSLPLDDFRIEGKERLGSICKSCMFEIPSHKICSGCKIDKTAEHFLVEETSFCRRLYSYCKECSRIRFLQYRSTDRGIAKIKQYSKEYYVKNKSIIDANNRQYAIDHKETIAEYQRKYKEENEEHIKSNRKPVDKERYNAYIHNRFVTDTVFRLKKNLRSRMSKVLKRGSKTGSAVKELGCTGEGLKKHLEKLFKPGMSWGNYGFYGWHIDHIKPLDYFDLTDIAQFRLACHYTNLQPLWCQENLTKGSKIKF